MCLHNTHMLILCKRHIYGDGIHETDTRVYISLCCKTLGYRVIYLLSKTVQNVFSTAKIWFVFSTRFDLSLMGVLFIYVFETKLLEINIIL